MVHCGARLQMPRHGGRVNRLESRRGIVRLVSALIRLHLRVIFPYLFFIIRTSDTLIPKWKLYREKEINIHAGVAVHYGLTASQDGNAVGRAPRRELKIGKQKNGTKTGCIFPNLIDFPRASTPMPIRRPGSADQGDPTLPGLSISRRCSGFVRLRAKRVMHQPGLSLTHHIVDHALLIFPPKYFLRNTSSV